MDVKLGTLFCFISANWFRKRIVDTTNHISNLNSPEFI